MDFNPRITIDSKVLPGVRFTVKRISPARRTAFRVHAAQYFAHLRDHRRKHKALYDEYNAALERARSKAQEKRDALVAAGKTAQEAETEVPVSMEDFPDEKFVEVLRANAEERELDQAELHPALIRTCLVGIDGFTLEGKAPNADELIADGPPELVDEIAFECNRVMGLTAAESGNWQSPGTSEPREAGQTTPTGASAAESKGTTD